MIAATPVLLLWTRTGAAWEAGRLAAARDALPPALVARMPDYRRWQDRQMGLLGKLLLRRGLSERGADPHRLAAMRWSDAGRPSLPGGGDFNITHSGGVVACALIDRGQLGLDVEQIRPTPLDDLALVMAPGERAAIDTAPDPAAALFHLWTFKEAVIKADGRGVGLDLQSFDCHTVPARVGGRTWYVEPVDLLPGFACHLASDLTPLEITVREVPESELLAGTD